MGLQKRDAFVHGPGREQDLGDKDGAVGEAGADQVHRWQHALVEDVAGRDALVQKRLGVFKDLFLVTFEHILGNPCEGLLDDEGLLGRGLAGGGGPGLFQGLGTDRAVGAGAERQAALLRDPLADIFEAREVGVRRRGIADRGDETGARCDRLEELVHEVLQVIEGGRFL